MSALTEYQDTLASDDHDSTAFGSPEHGTVVELLMCDYLGLDHVDGAAVDARDSDGTPIQIKGCRREHSNGGDETVPGRWDVWSETLLHLLADDGMYLLVVYNDDIEPLSVAPDNFEDYVLAWRFVSAVDFGALISPDSWHDGGREIKGDRARVFWTDVFDGVDE